MGIMKQQPTGPGCLSCTLDRFRVQGSASGKYRDTMCLVSAHQLFSVTKPNPCTAEPVPQGSLLTLLPVASRSRGPVTHCHSRTRRFAGVWHVGTSAVCELLVRRAPRKPLRWCKPPGLPVHPVLWSVAVRADTVGLGEALLAGVPEQQVLRPCALSALCQRCRPACPSKQAQRTKCRRLDRARFHGAGPILRPGVPAPRPKGLHGPSLTRPRMTSVISPVDTGP